MWKWPGSSLVSSHRHGGISALSEVEWRTDLAGFSQRAATQGSWTASRRLTGDLTEVQPVLWLLLFLLRSKLQPLEKMYGFHNFHSPPLSDMDFDALPQVLVIGIA